MSKFQKKSVLRVKMLSFFIVVIIAASANSAIISSDEFDSIRSLLNLLNEGNPQYTSLWGPVYRGSQPQFRRINSGSRFIEQPREAYVTPSRRQNGIQRSQSRSSRNSIHPQPEIQYPQPISSTLRRQLEDQQAQPVYPGSRFIEQPPEAYVTPSQPQNGIQRSLSRSSTTPSQFQPEVQRPQPINSTPRHQFEGEQTQQVNSAPSQSSEQKKIKRRVRRIPSSSLHSSPPSESSSISQPSTSAGPSSLSEASLPSTSSSSLEPSSLSLPTPSPEPSPLSGPSSPSEPSRPAELLSSPGLSPSFTSDQKQLLPPEKIREITKKKKDLREKLLQRHQVLQRSYMHDWFYFLFYTSKNLEINVHRNSILLDTFNSLSPEKVKTVDLLAPKLKVNFIGEDGYDAGGLTKEWFSLVSKQTFNPTNKYFAYVDVDNYWLQINSNSLPGESDFEYIGKFFALALYHGHLFNASIIKPIYKQILGKPIDLEDVKSFDRELYKRLLWIRDNDPSMLYQTFTWSVKQADGTTKEQELIDGGEDIYVDETNKEEYIKNVIRWKYVTSVAEKITAFLRGFRVIIPSHYLKNFNEEELELALCGSSEIDVDDWRNNTRYEYDGGYPRVIKWFWEVVRSFDDNMKKRLLYFITGSSIVPIGGFADLNMPFTIQVFGDSNRLPVAHTCDNRLELPLYTNRNQLKEKLLKAINETEGFFVV